MTARFAYFYLMRADENAVREAVPEHVAHWQGLGLEDYLGGPFEDRAGGLITFRSETSAQAERAVAADPFVTRGLLDRYWLKRWNPE